ncbi:MAG: AmmeMemoRadiSam system radical SAM enzyme [Dehalococcoidia bacterium]|nr:AmmeMemoRadiSam system radical SAM enzyme [Dehalococcoidia bacterium]
MAEGLLYEQMGGQRVRCNICLWRCVINPGRMGVCGVRRNEKGAVVPLNYARVSSLAADPIEKKPLFHFFPGSSVLSFGSIGCNFHCAHCQNWEIACADEPHSLLGDLREISSGDAVRMAKSRKCSGLAWTYNEPVIWLEYTLDTARLAHENGLYTAFVTNGYATPEALDLLGPHLDAWRVDVKGFTDQLYRRIARVSHWRSILDTAERARHKWNMHVEVVTNIIPTMNDDENQLADIAVWIREKLGELTPWHITRFYPHREMTHLPPTPLTTLENAYEIGVKAGLRFIYLGNVPGNAHEDTVCYNCGKTVIERSGYLTRPLGVNGANCLFCGADLNIRSSLESGVRK